MHSTTPTRRRSPRGRRRAFTLVELVTAATLMTVVMLGVIQVFAIITRAATQAQGIHYAQQQLRAVFDRMHNDLRGMTREGYLKIKCVDNTSAGARYHINTLAFVTVGPCASAWHTSDSSAYEAGAAEVVYTSNVRTPSTLLKVEVGGRSRDVDARRGVLARGQWMLVGIPNGSAGDRQDNSDRSVAWLTQMFGNQNTTTTTKKDRVTLVGGHVVVWPWTQLTGMSAYKESLSRVLACCVSEFYVESYYPASTENRNFFTPTTEDYCWATNFGLPARKLKSWPRALRVTVACHDPGDTSAGKTNERFKGYALQETIWLTDP